MKETGGSIAKWADETFGTSVLDRNIFERADDEMAELYAKVTFSPEVPSGIAEECADVVIVLARLAHRCGFDIFEMVDRKMEINRGREWVLDGKGQGQHKK